MKVLDGGLDLALVGLNIDNENQSLAIFNQFHRRLSRKRVLDDTMLVNSTLAGDTGSLVLGLTTVSECLGLVEVNLGVNAGSLLGNTLLQGL